MIAKDEGLPNVCHSAVLVEGFERQFRTVGENPEHSCQIRKALEDIGEGLDISEFQSITHPYVLMRIRKFFLAASSMSSKENSGWLGCHGGICLTAFLISMRLVGQMLSSAVGDVGG